MTTGTGVIGFGFMGRTHAAAFESARRAGYDCELRGIADAHDPSLAPDSATMPSRGISPANSGSPPAINPTASNGNLIPAASGSDFESVRRYADAAALLADPTIDIVSICTPTDTHVDLAIKALAAGKHVIVEKPVALDLASIERLADAAEQSGKVCLPAMCMRWWPGWSWLRDHIFSRTFGSVKAARFERLGPVPGWSSFYRNASRSGSALFDLHVHDADFVRWCFGEPAAVTSVGERTHLSTFYHYGNGPAHVVAEGGWLAEAGVPFTMRYRVEFERAVVEFDLAADPTIRVAQGGSLSPVEFPPETAYELQVRHALDLVLGRKRPLATVRDALKTTTLLHAELKSLGSRSRVTL
ncbi:MAG: Gfo/Idh/MocA family oxidoreductase [Gemmatimonadota bacterium]